MPSIRIRPLPSAPGAPPAPLPVTLRPLRPVQYLLTFRNPIFESVRVTLATPATTPGRFSSRVTVLCPQFEIDANTDVWDEALKDGGAQQKRGSGILSGTNPSAPTITAMKGGVGSGAGDTGQPRAEAGKIWERGRNWVSVAVEVVPASLRLDLLRGEGVDNTTPLQAGEDVLEIPMFVRVEWDTEGGGDEELGRRPTSSRGDRNRDGDENGKEALEKRELAYWCVLGIGRISQD